MSAVDIIIVLALLWGAFRGWKAGLIKEFFSTLGIVAGLALAYLLYEQIGEHFAPTLGSGSMASFAGCVLAFILVWVIVPVIFGIVANALTHAVKVICLGPLNKLGGLLLGAVKYFLLLSVVFSAMSWVGLISEQKRQDSLLYPYVTIVGQQIFGDKTIASEAAEEENEKTVIIKFNRSDKTKPAQK